MIITIIVKINFGFLPGSGGVGEWKSVSRTLKKKKKRQMRMEREQRMNKRKYTMRNPRTQWKRQRKMMEEAPALVEMTKKVLAHPWTHEQIFDLESISSNIQESKSRLHSVIRIFIGLKIVSKHEMEVRMSFQCVVENALFEVASKVSKQGTARG